MNILLLGGTGTLSSVIRDISLERDYTVTIFNRGKKNDKIPSKVNLIVGDFKDRKSLEHSFSNSCYDVVVDFLSRTESDIERIYTIFHDKCKQFIFISTACVYQRDSIKKLLTEDSKKPNLKWNYSIEKYECECRLKELQNLSGTSYYTIVRPYITYDNQRIPLGISPIPYSFHRTIIERIKAGKPWFVWDGGRSITTTTYATDFALGVVGLFMNEKAKNEVFHITSDCTCTNKQIVDMLFQKLHVKPNVVDVSTDDFIKILPEYKDILVADRALDALFDNSKIKSAVKDLKFKTTIDQGLERVIHYWDRCPFYEYDYKFEGRIDRLLSQYTKVGFVKYPHASKSAFVVYLLYRYLPLKWASKLSHYVK